MFLLDTVQSINYQNYSISGKNVVACTPPYCWHGWCFFLFNGLFKHNSHTLWMVMHFPYLSSVIPTLISFPQFLVYWFPCHDDASSNKHVHVCRSWLTLLISKVFKFSWQYYWQRLCCHGSAWSPLSIHVDPGHRMYWTVAVYWSMNQWIFPQEIVLSGMVAPLSLAQRHGSFCIRLMLSWLEEDASLSLSGVKINHLLRKCLTLVFCFILWYSCIKTC
jgi:hypothetical protein